MMREREYEVKLLNVSGSLRLPKKAERREPCVVSIHKSLEPHWTLCYPSTTIPTLPGVPVCSWTLEDDITDATRCFGRVPWRKIVIQNCIIQEAHYISAVC